MINTIIFDMGGVLVKTDEAIVDAVFSALKKNGLNPTDREIVYKAFGRSNRFNVETAVSSCYFGTDIDQVSDKCFKTFEQIFPNEVLSEFRLFSGNLEALQILKDKGVKLGIFTGFNRSEAFELLESLKIKDFFSVIVTLDDVKSVRPDPIGVLKALELLKAKNEECLYVGDTVVDIQMARNANLKCVCVKSGVQANQLLEIEKPDYFVEDIREMVRVIEIG